MQPNKRLLNELTQVVGESKTKKVSLFPSINFGENNF